MVVVMKTALVACVTLPLALAWGPPLALHGASRRDALASAVASFGTAAAVLGAAPVPAVAAESVDKRLAKFGLPPAGKPPGGFATTLEVYGRGSADRQKLLVKFNRPQLWVVVKPSVNTNGEDGTLSAGDYQKGDSAALFVMSEKKTGLSSKSTLQEIFAGAISQKSANVYENFKINKVMPGVSENGADYTLVDFQYDLLTGAGFVVNRKGVGSVTTIGKGTQAMVAATTSARWKKIEQDLREVVGSFRVYDGSNAAVASMYEY